MSHLRSNFKASGQAVHASVNTLTSGIARSTMVSNKRQRASEQGYVSGEENKVLSFENPLNATKGVLMVPIELREEVLHYFRGVNIYTETPSQEPILPVEYLEFTDVLRALSQVCVAYRRVFLPSLWESFMACHESRSTPKAFYAHAGNTLAQKCDGLSNNPDLKVHLR